MFSDYLYKENKYEEEEEIMHDVKWMICGPVLRSERFERKSYDDKTQQRAEHEPNCCLWMKIYAVTIPHNSDL